MSYEDAPEFQLLDASMGYIYSAALRAAARLNVADHLASGRRHPDELAAEMRVHGESLHRLLRYLATRGVFAEDSEGRFGLTPVAELLRSGVPGSMRSAVLMLTDEVFWKPAELLESTVRTGNNQFRRVFDDDFFEWVARQEEVGSTFHDGMASMSDSENRRIAESYDFSFADTIVDVGGGHGGFLIEVLRKHSAVRGVLFDEEHVLSQNRLDDEGFTARTSVVAGDFFDAVPSDADGYLLKRILHDWTDEQCARILSSCRRALSPNGRVLVVEAVLPAQNRPHPAKAQDVLLMNSLSGKERTEAEFRAVCTEAGLRVTRVLPTPTPMSIIEAVPA